MPSTPQNLLEILSRVHTGRPLRGGDVPLPDLQRQLEAMVVLGLIAPAGSCPYRLTAVGDQVLAGLTHRRCD